MAGGCPHARLSHATSWYTALRIRPSLPHHWGKVGGGLDLSKAVADNLGRYTQALLEIARQPGQRLDRD